MLQCEKLGMGGLVKIKKTKQNKTVILTKKKKIKKNIMIKG